MENFEEIYGQFEPPRRCAIKVDSTGEHCPEVGVHEIGDGEYICEKCSRAISKRPLPKLMDDLVPLPRRVKPFNFLNYI